MAQETLPLVVLYHLEHLEVLELPKPVDLYNINQEENVTVPQTDTGRVFKTHRGAKFSDTWRTRGTRPALETNVALHVQVCAFNQGKLRGESN